MKPTKDEITREEITPISFWESMFGNCVWATTAGHDKCDYKRFIKLLDQYTSHLYTQSELDREVVKARLDELVKLKNAHSINIFDEYLNKHITELTNQLKEK